VEDCPTVTEGVGMLGFIGRRLRVLIIEDNQHFRLLLRTVLGSMGVETIHEAHDGEHALALLKDTPVDLLIVDWKMTPLDGLSFVRKLRRDADPVKAAVPVLMVTGHVDAHLLRQARDAGVDDVLAKPLSAKDLIVRISGVMSRSVPFIRCDGYVGPERRRCPDPAFTGLERRHRRNSP